MIRGYYSVEIPRGEKSPRGIERDANCQSYYHEEPSVGTVMITFNPDWLATLLIDVGEEYNKKWRHCC